MISVYINSVGVAAPGFENWQKAAQVLRGEQGYEFTPLEKYKPTRLPPNERRRATGLVRLAFQICEDVFIDFAPELISAHASVFASSGGDYPIVDKICESLKTPERFVSPTLFHNSVHNSAAGYWSIAAESQQASTSISAHDASFAAGFLEAALFCQQENIPCLLASYDIVPPDFLKKVCPIAAEFGIALTLSTEKTPTSLGQITLSVSDADCAIVPAFDTTPFSPLLSNPSSKALPLMAAIACERGQKFSLQLTACQHLLFSYSPL